MPDRAPPREADPRPPEWRDLVNLNGDFTVDEIVLEPCNCGHLGPCPDGDPFAPMCPRRQHPAFREDKP